MSFGANGIVEQPFPSSAGQVDSVLPLRDGRILAKGVYFHGRHGGLAGIILYDGFPLARYNPDGSPDTGFGIQGIFNPPPSLGISLLQRDGKMVGVSQTGLTRFKEDGSPDAGFVLDGAAGIPWFADVGTSGLAQQADGKIVLAGNASFTVVLLRFNVDGSLDTTFNNVGAVIVPHGDADSDINTAGLVIQPDGKLVAAATSVVGESKKFTLIRYNPNGLPDTAFGNNGRASATFGSTDQDIARAVLQQPNGRLIIAGSHGVQLQLAGFRAGDGALDSGFGAAGVVRIAVGVNPPSVEVNDAKVQPDGKLLVAFGSYLDFSTYRLMRFNVDGGPDTAFGIGGTFASSVLPGITAIALLPDGDLILGGTSANNNFAIARFLLGTSPAIEFYNASLDHYFLSMNPQEIADLELGVRAGWQRTGLSFPVFGSLAAATAFRGLLAGVPVCRFYIPPEHGDSHFFSADLFECQTARGKGATNPLFSGYVEETATAFFVANPNFLTSACPSKTLRIYRLWNARFDSNHRYTTDPAIKTQMVARGYMAEGYGPDAVVMCAPN